MTYRHMTLRGMLGQSVHHARRTFRYLGYEAAGGTLSYDGPYDGQTNDLMPNKADGSAWSVDDGWVCNYTQSGNDVELRVCIGDFLDGADCCGIPPLPPFASITDTAVEQSTSDTLALPLGVGNGGGRALFAILLYYGPAAVGDLTAVWYPGFVNLGNPGSGQSMILVTSDTIAVDGGASDGIMAIYRLLAPAASTTGTACILFEHGSEFSMGAGWSMAGVDQAAPETDTAVVGGSGTSSSVTVAPGSGDVVLDMGGWIQTNATVTTPSATAGQTVIGLQTMNNAFGQGDAAAGAGYGSAGTATWSFGNSHPWLAAAVAVRSG